MLNSSEEIIIYADMKERDLRAEGVFIAEGRFLVERALRSGLKLHSVLCLPSLEAEFLKISETLPPDRRPPVYTASRKKLEELCGFPFHRGVLAAGYRPVPEKIENLLSSVSRILVCSDIRDPFNLGGLFRTAAALDWDALLLIDGSADPFSRASLRASMGSSLSLPWAVFEKDGVECTDLFSTLKKTNFSLVAAVLPRVGSVCVDEWMLNDGPASGGSGRKIALMLGNEGSGLSEERVQVCDLLLSIPMTRKVDSLNVGVAAGILMHELRVALKT